MSTKPHPVAITAAMLMQRALLSFGLTPKPSPQHVASVASRLHRLAKGAMRASVAECNGELFEGQRDKCREFCTLEDLDSAVRRYCQRIDRSIDKLNEELVSLDLIAERNGDPRGFVIKLYSTNESRPLPSNCCEAGVWGIA